MNYFKRDFTPDYMNLVDAARGKKAKRLPLYDHIVSGKVMEKITGKPISLNDDGSNADLFGYYRNFNNFLKNAGYDAVPFECGTGRVMPGSGALGGHKEGVIKTMEDCLKYDWDSIPDTHENIWRPSVLAMRAALPDGMKNVGGVGNGVFECVQDIVGFIDLCYIKSDDPDLYALLFKKVGEMSYKIWDRFTDLYDDMFCVYRFGDDLGYKLSPMLPPEDIRKHIIPQYKRIISMIKRKTGKPFLLHSCGNIFDVMDDLIDAGIDAKHSNEDVIAPFTEWVRLYNGKIGLFGGIDTDALCDVSGVNAAEYIANVVNSVKELPGIAIGCGNSIADYVSPDRYMTMCDIVRSARGE